MSNFGFPYGVVFLFESMVCSLVFICLLCVLGSFLEPFGASWSLLEIPAASRSFLYPYKRMCFMKPRNKPKKTYDELTQPIKPLAPPIKPIEHVFWRTLRSLPVFRRRQQNPPT
jgi:hypothetical protein